MVINHVSIHSDDPPSRSSWGGFSRLNLRFPARLHWPLFHVECQLAGQCARGGGGEKDDDQDPIPLPPLSVYEKLELV